MSGEATHSCCLVTQLRLLISITVMLGEEVRLSKDTELVTSKGWVEYGLDLAGQDSLIYTK